MPQKKAKSFLYIKTIATKQENFTDQYINNFVDNVMFKRSL
uniref:Uncharacterized protein n=1 Tax=Arundo donax TaxID=35708 RepID=A0A0A8ZEI2_ARUDO